MKLILLIAFLASAACFTSAKKLLVVGGLNGGLVTGLNGGLLNPGLGVVNPGLGVVNPGLGVVNPVGVVGGVNPALLPFGGAMIGPQPIAPMLPAVSPYMLQPPIAAAPFGMPFNQPQLPQQLPANGGLPFFAPPNRQVLPPQQQAVGVLNPVGNGQQPQGDMPAGPLARFRRSLYNQMQDKSTNSNPQVTPTPSILENLAQ